MDTWEIILNALVRILREQLPDELARRDVAEIRESQIDEGGDHVTLDDGVFITHSGDDVGKQCSEWVDGRIEYVAEIVRFGSDKREVRKSCSRTKAAVCRVLRDHMGLDAEAQAALSNGFKQVLLGKSEPAEGKKQGRFARAQYLPIFCDVKSSRRADGSAPDL
ncbi:MAG TPA: hypothetical protein QGH10_19295 [Armatimonadota bacterium]|nr:hypothetical protein [Armatimonadota bacterium]